MRKRFWLAILCAMLALVSMALLPLTIHIASAEETYTITWINDDGTQLAITEVAAGETPVYSGETPTKETDADYVYTFYGWDPEPEPATADATYTAIYSAQIRPDKCGDNLYWTFDESTGTLTVTGSGEMTDYYSSTIPWYSIRSMITTVILPEELTSIGQYAFYNCPSLTSVDLGNNITRVGSHAFEKTTLWNNQSGLVYLDYILLGYNGTYPQTISITSSTKTLADWAFANCAMITNLRIPDDVKNIGEFAFYGCTSLQSLIMPCDTIVQSGSFGNCTSITSVRLSKGTGIMPDYSINGDLRYYNLPWHQSRDNALSITLEEGIRNIGDNAFYSCTGLTEIIIPDSVTSISDSAFYGCTGMTSITIGNNVSSIDSKAFYNCTNLMSITMPCSAVFMNDTFTGCRAITSVHLTKGTGSMTNYTEPYSYNVTVPWYQSRSNALTVTLDEGIQNIGNYAFYYCTGLTQITIPNSVTNIGECAFIGCTGLTEITIPEKVTSIGRSAFNRCTGLTEIILPNGLVSIDSGAFFHCTGLTEIKIPESVTGVGESAFSGCTSLMEVTIGNNVSLIGDYAFAGCTGLTSVTIGSGVTSIGYRTFYSCDSLADVYYNGTRSDRERKLTISSENNPLLRARWHYLTESLDGIIEWNAEDVQFKGATPYVICNGSAQTPRFTVKNAEDGSVIEPVFYDYEYRENIDAGTGYVIVTFKGDYTGECQGWFKIYLPATKNTYVENVSNGIKLTWDPVEGVAGYVIYRRAWSSTTNGWTTFERWNNTTETTYIDGMDARHKVYAGTRYQYGVKAYFARRIDPVSGATIGGNVGDNYNLGEVGPLKTTVRITTRVLNSVTPGSRQLTVKWAKSSVFTGYQLQYATDAAFTKNVNAIKISDPKTGEKILTGLKAKTTYYVRVRSYHEFNGVIYYGEWSNVISAKTK